MSMKLGVLSFLFVVATAKMENQLWDLAVVINGKVEVLDSNGTLLGAAARDFAKLKALTFDLNRKQFVVSDTDEDNDTIYTLQLSKETDIIPLIADLPDDVQGLAIDPYSDTLYWTDSINRSISYMSLKPNETRTPTILLQFEEEKPQDIVVDFCKKDLYWTNSYMYAPTIERSTLAGDERRVIVSTDLFMPTGVAIDQAAGRLYWADIRTGIYFRVESAKLDGTDRRVLYKGSHQKPFGIAVDGNSVYWTDRSNAALWRKSKLDDSEPVLVRKFDEAPFGIVARNLGFPGTPDCEARMVPDFAAVVDAKEENVSESCDDDCLNGGHHTRNCSCACPRGFAGRRCEISLCYNYCGNGRCHVSSMGQPQCRCEAGYAGKRCETDVCSNFCLHGGACSYDPESPWGATCRCPEGFRGSRCEIQEDSYQTYLCGLFCRQEDLANEIIINQHGILKCSCEDGKYTVIEKANITEAEFLSERIIVGYFQSPVLIAMSVVITVLAVIVISLTIFVCKLKKLKPRIRKRIVVNKNLTPLTYRPQPPAAQCEITIENCCNMNVCETPCFEPASITDYHALKKDEKKNLLLNMENADDLY